MPTELTETELVRNFADYLNRVAFRAERFIILRSNKPVAELRPLPAGRRLGDLAGIFESMPRLTDDELDALALDIGNGRSELAALPIQHKTQGRLKQTAAGNLAERIDKGIRRGA